MSTRVIVDRCLSRRDCFVDNTVGEAEYASLMCMSKRDLQNRVNALVKKRISERVGEEQLKKFLSFATKKTKEGF